MDQAMTFLDDTALGDTVPGATTLGDAAPGDTALGDTTLGDAAADDAAAAARDGLIRAVLDGAAAVIGLDARGRVVLCSRAAADLLGMAAPALWRAAPAAEALARSTALDDHGRAALGAMLAAAVEAAGPAAAGFDAAAPLGVVPLAGGRVLRAGLAQASAHFALVSLAATAGAAPAERVDGLTGLPDRAWFHERLSDLLAAAGEAEQVAVLMVNLDRFKAVNDAHGHAVGNALLRLVARRLRGAVRDADVVSRLGADEFAVAMPGPSDAPATAARLADVLSRPYLVEGRLVHVDASIGIALGPQDGATTPALARAADLALRQAKEDGRRAVRRFTAAMDLRARARHGLQDDLRRAIALRQFELHYQPQTNLRSGRLTGFEALIRWRHPAHGLVPPDQFIPLAEDMGLIVPLGEWVLRTACREAAAWPDHLTVAVNVSAKQLADRERLPRAVRDALAAAGLPACRLDMEITESALVRYEAEALDVMRALRAMGVALSMDDFGTGYSSLSQLRSFPFDKLKIDRSFIRDLSCSAEAAAVVRAVAALGSSLGMTTIAEGVETAEQERLIRADGCTDMQGYLVSRPVPAEQVAALIDRLCADGPA